MAQTKDRQETKLQIKSNMGVIANIWYTKLDNDNPAEKQSKPGKRPSHLQKKILGNLQLPDRVVNLEGRIHNSSPN